LHNKFLSDGERRARNVGPAGFLNRFDDAGEAALLGATSRLSSVRLEQAFRLSERVVEAVGINRDRAAIVARRDRQNQFAFLKLGEAEQLAAEPKLSCLMVGLSSRLTTRTSISRMGVLLKMEG
jgi:hypothetical protein